MNRHVHVLMVCLSLTMALSIWIVGAHSAAAQTSQPNDPVAVITAFNAAVSGQDLTAALALLDDNFQYVSGPGSALPTSRKKGEFPGQPPFQQVAQSNIHLINATAVEMDLTFSGGPIPTLPHPFMLHANFTVENGLITRLQDRLSDQTAQDLAALPPPPGAPAQLPKTGESNAGALSWLLVLGVLCVLAGATIWRVAGPRRTKTLSRAPGRNGAEITNKRERVSQDS